MERGSRDDVKCMYGYKMRITGFCVFSAKTDAETEVSGREKTKTET